jgi:hypothetical protein
MLLDEEFHEYQKLLDSIQVKPTLITLPCLPKSGAAPRTTHDKRLRTTLHKYGEGEAEDTGASDSGTHFATWAEGSMGAPLTQGPNPTRQETHFDQTSRMSRDDTVTTFVTSPPLPESDRVRVERNTTLLALAIDGPT